MKECPKCGYCESEVKEEESFEVDDKEVTLKNEILEELMELMSSSIGEKLKQKKPKAISIEALTEED